MTRRVIAVGALALLLTLGSIGELRAQESRGREDILAAASDDIGPGDVGRLFTARFRPLVGATNSVLPAGGTTGAIRHLRRSTTERELAVVRSRLELQANARAWGIGGASTDVTLWNHHAYFRAVSIEDIYEMDDRLAIPTVPEGAEWYISAVYVGRLYEVHFTSASSSLEGRIHASMLGGSGSISGFAQRLGLDFHARTVGLEPRSDNALFASSDAEMRQRYRASGPPRPILVQYSRVPASARPRAATNRPRHVELLSVRFPDRNPQRNTAWDAFGGKPDILVRVTQGNRVLLDRFGGRDKNPATFSDAVIGNALVVTPQQPLVFTFADRDLAANDDAGTLVLQSLPDHDEREYSPPPGGRGVRVVLRVSSP